MKRLLVTCVALAAAPATCAAAPPPPPPPTTTTDDARTHTLYLSGHDKDDAVPWDFTCSAGRNANVPSTIRVPSNWELQGFGIFSYGYEHRGSKAKPAEPVTPVRGTYHTTFTPPADAAGRRAFLVFEGVMTDAQASVNNRPAGPVHRGGYYRFRREVTSLLVQGKPNALDVVVDDESADPTVNDAERRGDYFNYGGIFRPVYLETVPPQFLDRVAIDARADGSFALDAFADGVSDADTIEAQVYDAAGQPVGAPFAAPLAKGSSTRIQAHLGAPRLWTAETPNLYTVEVRLKRGDAVVHAIRQRFGFRTIEVRRGDGVYVNGSRVMLKGADRHSFWPDSGRCTSATISRDDVALMRGMNMNAVRMSHYPPDQHFLDACDEAGLYVLDEIAGWHGAYGDAVGHDVVRETVARDVNHPSILFWDNGNEGGWNVHLDADFAAYDPQHRHVLHPWADFDGVDTKHYPVFSKLQSLAAGETVFFPTEFLHALYDGGGGAGLADYWDVIRASKVSAGGFVWSLLDEAPKRVDLDGRLDTRGNLAPDGIVGPYREKEASYYTIKQLWSPVVVTDKTLPPDGQFTVENRYDFTDLKDCRFSYELRRFASPADAGEGTDVTVIGRGAIAAPAVLPRGTGRLVVPPAAMSADADALAIRLEDPAGRELFTPVFPLPHAATYRELPDRAAPPGATAAVVSKDADALTVRAADLTLAFSAKTGYLSAATRAGKPFPLTNGPRPVAGDATLVSLDARQDGGDVVVSAAYAGALDSVECRVRPNGWVTFDVAYSFTGPADFLGVGFDFPEPDVRSLRWLGDGPTRVYKNRAAGPTLGVWQNDYNDSITGSIPWQYPEFKGYFAAVRWAQYQTADGPLTFLVHQDDLFLQNFVPTAPPKALVAKTAVPYPPTSIALLHAIPAIGTKFGAAPTLGPASQRPVGTGKYRAVFSVYFGEVTTP